MTGHNIAGKYTKVVRDRNISVDTILCECLETFMDTDDETAATLYQQHVRVTAKEDNA